VDQEELFSYRIPITSEFFDYTRDSRESNSCKINPE